MLALCQVSKVADRGSSCVIFVIKRTVPTEPTPPLCKFAADFKGELGKVIRKPCQQLSWSKWNVYNTEVVDARLVKYSTRLRDWRWQQGTLVAKKGSWAESREMFRKALGGWSKGGDKDQSDYKTLAHKHRPHCFPLKNKMSGCLGRHWPLKPSSFEDGFEVSWLRLSHLRPLKSFNQSAPSKLTPSGLGTVEKRSDPLPTQHDGFQQNIHFKIPFSWFKYLTFTVLPESKFPFKNKPCAYLTEHWKKR